MEGSFESTWILLSSEYLEKAVRLLYVWETDHPYYSCARWGFAERVYSTPFFFCSPVALSSFLPDEKTGPTPEAKTLCEPLLFQVLSPLALSWRRFTQATTMKRSHTIVCYTRLHCLLLLPYYCVCVSKEYQRTTKKKNKRRKNLFLIFIFLKPGGGGGDFTRGWWWWWLA